MDKEQFWKGLRQPSIHTCDNCMFNTTHIDDDCGARGAAGGDFSERQQCHTFRNNHIQPDTYPKHLLFNIWKWNGEK